MAEPTRQILGTPQFVEVLPGRSAPAQAAAERKQMVALLAGVRGRPGVWALLGVLPSRNQAQGLTGRIRRGDFGGVVGEFETATRSMPDGFAGFAVYARFTPLPDPSPRGTERAATVPAVPTPAPEPVRRPPARTTSPRPPVVPAPQTGRQAQFVLCECGHAEMRHNDDGCCRSTCGCLAYRPATT